MEKCLYVIFSEEGVGV